MRKPPRNAAEVVAHHVVTETGSYRLEASPGYEPFHPGIGSPSDQELAKHKIREALTNLQDVLRFLEVP